MSRLFIWNTAWLLDQGEQARNESSMSKIFCSEAAFRIVDRAMQTLGGMGITDDTLVERLFREILRGYKKRSLKPEEQQPGIFERSLDSIKDLFGQVPAETNVQQAEIQTPPLPNTPMPVVRTAQAVNPNTNLTRTQEALLSPEEKIIASRTI